MRGNGPFPGETGVLKPLSPGVDIKQFGIGLAAGIILDACGVSKLGARPEKLAICRQDANFGTPQATTQRRSRSRRCSRGRPGDGSELDERALKGVKAPIPR
jgi:hypothetical protein